MTTDRDTVWMVLVTYARAAGARDADLAGFLADQAVSQGDAPFRELCERIDRLAMR